jgi:MFS transporter, ENTS family, enterobactin (siderophore) exporter
MVPSHSGADHPLRSLGAAFTFLGRQRWLLAVFGVGTVLTLTASVRIAFPALVIGPLGGGAREIGLMYTAVPVGAVLGAVSSGWVQRVDWPERALSILCALACAALMLLGVSGHIAVALGALVIYGYASSVAGLVQYALVQQHTPDRLLGRINSLGMAQDVVGDSLGVLGVGTLVAWLPTCGITLLGLLALMIGGSLALPLMSGRRGADLTAHEVEG